MSFSVLRAVGRAAVAAGAPLAVEEGSDLWAGGVDVPFDVGAPEDFVDFFGLCLGGAAFCCFCSDADTGTGAAAASWGGRAAPGAVEALALVGVGMLFHGNAIVDSIAIGRLK